MRVGYARFINDQLADKAQIAALKRARCSRIVEEPDTAIDGTQPGLVACLKSLRQGDTLVVWRVDRMARDLTDLIALTGDLYHRGIGFRSIAERINTRSRSGREPLRVLGDLAAFQASVRPRLPPAGPRRIRAVAATRGRPKKMSSAMISRIRSLLDSRTARVTSIAAELGAARSTVYRNVSRR